jgi:hypothetical protein
VRAISTCIEYPAWLRRLGGLALVWSVMGCSNFDLTKSRDGAFAVCCGGLGTCVARGLVADSQKAQLSQDTCSESLLCVPSELVLRGPLHPQVCLAEATGAEGRCLPACLPEVATRQGVRQDGCAAGQLCAPCYDPLSGESTGACQLGKDPGPTEPPVVFAACCEGLGRCVPEVLVPSEQQKNLASAGCEEDALCVPTDLAADTTWRAPVCTDPQSDAEGRCLPACLPNVAERAEKLSEANCGAGRLCAPCTDPVTGDSTGACSLGGDDGPGRAPVIFPDCCEARGRCVPEALVSASDREQLDGKGCDERALCVPDLLARDERASFAHCEVTSLSAEGRCLPACLPGVETRAARLRSDGCGGGELCAPCFDPVDGEASGACAIGGDTGPTQPPVVFADCCGGLGRCVPSVLLQVGDQKHLGSDSCAGPDERCVPDGLAVSDAFVAQTCVTPVTGLDGRCLPACLPELAAQADVLARGSCGAGELCAPCFDPVTGRNTGACNFGGDPGPTSTPSRFPDCCGDLGRCVPMQLIAPQDRSQLSAGGCSNAADLCLPEPLLLDADAVFASCSARATGAEGRCLPACLPGVAQRAQDLGQESCGSGELCTPCFDPFDGSATGACALGGDPGPTSMPMPFGDCCGELGRCVPRALLSAEELTQVGADNCAAERDVCVPEPLAMNPDHVFAGCHTSTNGAEGRCLPGCLPDVASRAGQLRQDGCAAGHLCTPCFEPLDGTLTGACTLGGDTGPKEPARLFADCCGDVGRCVPEVLVSTADRVHVAHDSCGTGALCVPEALARSPQFTFSACTVTSSGAEGRCLPACLPEVTARAKDLTRESCSAEELCSPCTDPFDGTSTGACSIGGDSGPTRPPTVFDACCGDQGRCVPSGLVDAADRGHLARDTCGGESALCAPTALAKDRNYTFPQCSVGSTGAEGRCLPECLPEVLSRASQLQTDGCGTGRLCTPCYEPLDGAATGACEIGGDSGPVRPPVVFPDCCGDLGRCVPPALVADDDEARLGHDVCGAEALCTPEVLARDGAHVFPACTLSQTGAEGRCLPACLPEVAARGDTLAQDGCAGEHRCTPCYDPLDGTATGACALGGDPGPSQPAFTYPSCCTGAGRCIPSSQVPADARGRLDAGGCTGAGAPLCVPVGMARNPGAVPATCHDSATAAEGRCLMQCLPEVASRASRLRQSGCAEAELCVPCYDPVTGESTGACSFAAADSGPREPAVVFAACCGGDGLCVPSAAMPGGSSNLPRQACQGSSDVCAPRVLVADPNAHLPRCNSGYGTGACVLSCYVSPLVQGLLTQATCAGGEMCAPCWAASGACQ